MIKFKEILQEDFMTYDKIKSTMIDTKILWHKHLDKNNINAAMEYLNLNVPRKIAEEAKQFFLKNENRIEYYKVKDIIRSSTLTPLPKTNPNVERNLLKIKEHIKLNPVLLVKYDNKLFIADGFHRVSAVYSIDENERVACVLIGVK